MSVSNVKRHLFSKQGLHVGLALVLIFISIVFYLWLTNPKSFPITHVVVKGSYPHVSSKQLQKIIMPYVRQSFFGLSAKSLEKSVEKIPWVAKANIRRQFPSTIMINITEEKPLYIWNDKILMTKSGSLFRPALATFPKNLPRLRGPDQENQLLFSTMQSINQLLQPLQLTLTTLSLSKRGAWTMTMSNGIKVMVGKHRLWTRLKQFVRVYSQSLAAKQKKIVSIDLRYPNGFAVMWQR